MIAEINMPPIRVDFPVGFEKKPVNLNELVYFTMCDDVHIQKKEENDVLISSENFKRRRGGWALKFF